MENLYETNVLHDDLIKKRDWQWKQDKRSSLNEQDDELLKVSEFQKYPLRKHFLTKTFKIKKKLKLNGKNKFNHLKKINVHPKFNDDGFEEDDDIDPHSNQL